MYRLLLLSQTFHLNGMTVNCLNLLFFNNNNITIIVFLIKFKKNYCYCYCEILNTYLGCSVPPRRLKNFATRTYLHGDWFYLVHSCIMYYIVANIK